MSKRFLFLFAAIILFGVGIFFRASSTRSARTQAEKITQADTAGADTAADVASLKTYSASHMGASVKFALKGAYARAQAAAEAAATAQAAASAANSQIYAEAQRQCSGKSDSITQAKCNQAYLSAHLASVPAAPASVPAPKESDFQYDLKAPFWTPDLAGALLIGALVAFGFSIPFGRRKQGH